ncbi:carcinine hydrolase/isopenicillin-N N-acyltransferase family protein [Streptomyces sp. NPDC008343]|uniref:carcinine hydrolase/isopenicillin-N N-acyltransferase family protein n=1 Tax=Streptomyces sp. NPDC008343 TaxID=3364828 RepID=UPI0036E124FA
MQVEAGQIGRQGANSAGIALNTNGLGGRFGEAVGLPQTVVRRSVLDQANISAALDVLCRTRAHIASNALLTCREGFAIDLETTPAGHGWLYPADGLLVHGNHYQAGIPAALADGYRPIAADSLVRVPRAKQGLRRLRDSGGTDESRKLIKDALSDHLGFPASLCTHADPRKPAVRHWTTLVTPERRPHRRRLPRHRRHPVRPRVPTPALKPLRRPPRPELTIRHQVLPIPRSRSPSPLRSPRNEAQNRHDRRRCRRGDGPPGLGSGRRGTGQGAGPALARPVRRPYQPDRPARAAGHRRPARRHPGVALVFVSHDLAVIRHITDETVVMRRGRVVEQGPTDRVLGVPEDPYTRLLLASVPRRGWDPADAVRARVQADAA